MQTHEHSEPLLIGVLPLDICRNRHRDAPESVAANPSDDAKRKDHKLYLDYAKGGRRIWLKLLCRVFHKQPNEVSPRLSELKQMGLLKKTGEREEHCAVLVLASH